VRGTAEVRTSVTRAGRRGEQGVRFAGRMEPGMATRASNR
jgi:hypothetical protein